MRAHYLFSLLLLAGLAMVPLAPAQEKGAAPSDKPIKAVLEKGYAYLKSAQNNNGSFAPKIAGPGVSALVAAALLKNGYSPKDPVVAKTLKYLKSSVRADGGIYGRVLANYTTSIAVMALKEANTNGQYDAIIKNAVKFLKQVQHLEPETQTGDVQYGGFGYDKGSRPDLSNTNFSVDALLAAGVPKDDPSIQKALKFISRCQNLPGEGRNDQAFAKKAGKDDKGGLTYTPFPTNGKYKNGYTTAAGGLRSLGSMTYGGLKSFLYAGVKKDDPRVKAAVDWVRRHYTLTENPGMGKAGLYYYYHTFAKAMEALGEDVFTDAAGKKHNWRRELFQTLKAKQRADGSWVNERRDRFGEGVPELATAFAMLSLSYAREEKK